MNRLFSIQEVANILGVSAKTLRRWEEKGILKPHRTPGNQRRYTQEQIDNFRQFRSGLPPISTQFPEITPSQLLKETPPVQIQKSAQYWTEELVKSILIFKKLAVSFVFVMLFVAVVAVGAATLKSANLLNLSSLPKVLSFLGINKSNPQSQLSEVLRTRGKAVLGTGTEGKNLIFGVNVASEFADSAQFLNTIKVAGIATLSGGVITENQDVNAGTGKLTASNVLYGAIAGEGIAVGPGQTPTITNTAVLSLTAGSGISVGTGSKPTVSNTGVLSLGGSTGALTLAAGTGISVSGLTITNNDLGSSQNIFKTIAVTGSTSIAASSNTDTLTFEAGTGITLSSNTSSKKVTITGAGGWQENNGALSPSNITDDLLLGGISTSTAKFAFINNASGTPVASMSATSTGLVLSADGTIQSIRNATLTLGGNTTGSIVLSPLNGNGDVKIQGTTTLGNIVYTWPTGGQSSGFALTTNGSGSLSWQDLGSAVSNFWRQANGAVYTANSTVDLLIGTSTGATTSAKFAVLNMNSGTPTASVSATATGTGLVLGGDGTMQSLLNATLTIGGNTTGNITLDPLAGSGTTLNTGNLNLSTGKAYQIAGTSVLSATTLGTGVLTSSLTTVGALASGSIATGFGTISTANTITGTTLNGTTGINTGAGAGTQRIDSSGNLVSIGTTQFNSITYTWPGSQTANYTLTTNGSGTLSWSDIGVSPGNFWRQSTTGLLYPANSTVDLAIGGTSSSSAKFAVLNVLTGTPTASVSAGTGGGAYLTATGNLATTAKQSLTFGGSSTGDIIFSNSNNIYFAGANLYSIDTNGNSYFAIAKSNKIETGFVNGNIISTGSGTLTLGAGKTLTANSTITLAGTDSKTLNLDESIDFNAHSIGFGGTTPTETLTLTSGKNVSFADAFSTSGSFALTLTTTAATNVTLPTTGTLITNTASANQTITSSQTSGTVFGLTDTTNLAGAIKGLVITLSGTGVQDQTGLEFALSGATGTNLNDIVGSGSTWKISTTGNATFANLTPSGTTGTFGWFQRNSQALSPTNITDDLLLGGIATTSAKIAFINIAGGTPTATLSATTTGLSLDASGTIQSLRNATLTIGGNTTGSITLDPLSGSGTTLNTGNFNLSTGKAYQINGTSILSSTTLGSGVTTSSLTSVGTLTTGVWNATAIGVAYGGLGGNVTPTGGGEVLYSTGTTAYTRLAAGSSNQCLLSGGTGAPSWANCALGDSTNWFTQTNGALYPINSTLDFLIGGTSTTAAKFAVLNMNSGTPTASVSAGTAGASYLTAAGNLATTAKQTLTLGDTNTGEIVLSPGGTTALTGRGTNLIGAGTLTGLTGLTSSGTITFSGFTSNGGPLYTNGSGVLAQTTAGTTTQVLHGGTTPSFSAVSLTADVSGILPTANGGSWWNSSLGSLYPGNSTLDLLVGGTASNTAKFAFINVATGTPTASIAGNLTLDSLGVIQTTKNQTLTIGGASTGNIVLSPLNGGAGANVTIQGTTTLNTVKYTWPGADGSNGFALTTNGSGTLSWNDLGTSVSNYWRLASGTVYTANSTVDLLIGTSTGASTSAKFAVLNINSGTPTASLSAGTGGGAYLTATGNLATTAKQTLTLGDTNTGNIILSNLTFANAGLTIASGQNLTLAGITGDNRVLYANTSTGVTTGVTATSISNLCLMSGAPAPAWGNCPGSGTGASKWTELNGVLYPNNSTVDLLVGGTASNAAKFAVLNVLTGTPTASLSAGTAGGAYLSASGTLATTANQNLTIGGATTGNITLDPLSGSGTTLNTGSFNLSTGKAYQINGTSILSATTLGTGVTTSSLTSVGTLTTGVWNATAIGVAYGGLGGNVAPTGAGEILYSTGTTAYTRLAAGSSNQCLLSGGAGAPSWANCALGDSTNWFTQTNGALYPINSTLDFLIGGTSTTAAKFAFINVSSGTPTASVSAGTGGASYLTAAGTLQTTANQALTIGGNTTGNITLDPLSGSGTTLNTGNFNLSAGKTYQIAGTDVLSATTLGTGVTTSSLTTVGALASGSIATGFGTISTANTITGTTLNGTTGINTGAGAGTQRIDSSGNLKSIGTTQLNTVTYTWPSADGSSGNALTTSGTGTLSWTNTAGFGTNYWDQTLGTLQPFNKTVDLLIGGAASTSAKFAVLNVLTGTPTASLSAGTAGGAYLTAAGNLATTAKQTLTLGDTTTGEIVLSPGGTTALTGRGANLIGAGTLTGLTGLTSSGTITFSGFTSNGGPLYTNGSGVLAQTTAGTTTQCLLGGITPTFGSCGTGETSDIFWDQAQGALYPDNSTVDLLIGGTSTAAAKFAVLNINSGTPTASVSAGTAGASYLTAAGTLQTTANQALTLGGATTGNITLSPLNGSGTTLNTGNFNLSTGKAYQINGSAVLDATTLGSGVTTSSLTTVGTIGTGVWQGTTVGLAYGGTNANLTAVSGGIVYSGASALAISAAGSSNQCLLSGGTGAPTWGTCAIGTIWWNQTSGALYPNNSTLDLLIGGQSSASAKFAVLNMNSGTPTASISATATGTGLVLGGDGTIQSLRNATLTLGGNTTGSITLDPLSGSGTTLNTGNFNLSTTKAYQIAGTDVLSATTLGTGVTTSSLTTVGALASGSIATGFGTISTANTITGTTLNGTTGINTGAGAGTQRIDLSGNLVSIGTTQFNSITYTWPGTQSNTYILQTNGSGTLSWIDPGTLPSTNFWDRDSGAIYPKMATVLDLLIGGQSSSSAKFAVLNMNSGTPTASLSAGTAGGAYLTAAGTLATTAKQTLTLGDTATGEIVLSPGGTTALTARGANLIGAGTLTGLTGLTSSGTITFSGFTSNGGPLYTNGSGVLAQTTAGTTTQCLLGGITPTFGSCGTGETSDIFWDQAQGALYPDNSTVDLLIGGTSTAAAKFAVLNMNSGTPTASVSAQNAAASALVLGSDSTIQSVKNQTLTIGGGTTGNIVLSPNNGSGGLVTVNAPITATTFNKVTITQPATASTLTIADGKTLTANSTLTLAGTDSKTLNLDESIDFNAHSIGFGGTTPTETLTLTSGKNVSFADAFSTSGSFALTLTTTAATNVTLPTTGTLITNTASANQTITSSQTSGTVFGLTDTTNLAGAIKGLVITLSGTGVQDQTGLEFALSGATGTNLNDIVGSGSTWKISTTGNATFANLTPSGTTGTFGWFQRNSQALSPTNITDDLLLGGIATTSAKIAFINIAGGTPTATLSATTTGLSLDASGTIQSLRNATLTIGGNTTGNITLDPLSGSGTTLNTGNFNLSTGKAYQIAGTSVLSGTTLGTGVTTSSLTTVGTIGTGVWQGTAVGVLYGGTGQTTYTDGQLLIGNTTGNTLTKATLTAGAGIAITNGSGSITIASKQGDIDAFWNQSATGLLFPNNSTVDLAIGGQASSSAKFAVLNVNSGTPTASVSATATGTGLSLGGDGTIQSLKMGTLTLGGSTTGDIVFKPGNATNPTLYLQTGGNVGIGTTAPGALLDIGLAGTTLGVVRLAGNTSGNVTIQPAAAAGTWTFTLPTSGGTNTYALTTNGSGVSSWSQINLATAVSGILPTANGGSWWNSSLGALYPGNSTLDLLVGSTATSSAPFAFFNVSSGTPTASISAAGAAIGSRTGLVLGADATIQSLLKANLTLGGSTTGGINFTPGNIQTAFLSSIGRIGFGTQTAPKGLLDISGNSGNNAALNVNQSGTGVLDDIFTASRSGTPVFTIANTGSVYATSSATTTDAFSIAGNSLTTGNGLNILSTSANLSSAKLLNVDHTATYITAGAITNVTGKIASLNRDLTVNRPTATITADIPISDAGQKSGNSGSWSHTTGSGINRILIVSVVTENVAQDASSITYGGSSLTKIPGCQLYSYSNVQMWYLLESGIAAASSSTIEVTLPAADPNYWTASGVSYSGVNQTSTFRASCNTESGTSSQPSLSVTSQNGDLAIDAIALLATSPTLTVGSGQTERWNQTATTLTRGAYSDEPATGSSVNMAWTVGGGGPGWVHTGVALVPSPGSLNITGSVASIASNCTVTAGSCTDSSNILSLTQSYGLSTGAVLNITSSGLGAMLNISGASGGQAAAIINQTSTTQNILAASSSGVTKFVINNIGRVGVGNATPIGLLDITGSAGQNAAFILNQTGTNANDFILAASSSGVTKFVINNIGRVGVGNATPIGLLDISGNSGNNAALILNQTDFSPNADLFTASKSGSTVFTINNWGSVFATSSATQGDAFSIVANSLTTGKGLNILSTSTNFTSAKLLNVDHTATYSTSQTNSGNLLNLNRAFGLGDTLSYDSAWGSVVATATTPQTFSFTAPAATNRMIIVGVGFANTNADGVSVSTITWGSTSLSQIPGCTKNNTVANNIKVEMWYAVLGDSSTAQTDTVTVTPTGGSSSDWYVVEALSYKGVSQAGSGSFRTTCNAQSGDSQFPNTGAVSSSTGDLVVDASAATSSATFTADSGNTQRTSFGKINVLRMAMSEQAGAATVTNQEKITNAERKWVSVGVSMKPVGTILTLSGALANLTSNCTPGAGSTCTDSSNILSLTQSYGLSTGAVLNITSSGLGSMLNLSGSSGGKAAAIINQTATGGGADIFTASASGATIFTVTGGSGGDLLVGAAGANTTTNIGGNGILAYGAICADDSLDTADDCIDAARTAGTVYGIASSFTIDDIAENFPTLDDSIEAGDVISLNYQPIPDTPPSDPFVYDYETEFVQKSTTGSAMLGIISEKPGVLLGGHGQKTDPRSVKEVPVVLSGRVPVKVSTENGEIKAGDSLTSSSKLGVAMKATKPGMVIGTALKDYSNPDPNIVGKISVFINLSWKDPRVQILSDGSVSNPYAQFSAEQASQLLGLISPPASPSAGSGSSAGSASSLQATSSGSFDLARDQNFVDLKNRVASVEAQIEDLRNSIVNSSTQSAFLASINSQPAVLGASTSADFVSNLQNLDIQSATISGDLMVLGRTTLTDLGVTGNIAAGLLSIHGLDSSLNNGDGGASINSIGDLNLQSNQLGGINILAGKVTIDTSGNIKTEGEITVKKVNIDTTQLSSASLGSATLSAGDTSVVVSTTAVTGRSRILVTPTTKTGNQVLVVSNKSSGNGFTITIEQPYDRDIKFDWWIVDEAN